MLLVLIDKRLQRLQPFLPETDPEPGFPDHDRFLVDLCFLRDIGLAGIQIGKLITAVLNGQKQIRKPGHEGAMVDSRQ